MRRFVLRAGRARPDGPEDLRVIRRALILLALVIAIADTSAASAGGIADEPCPNARGEHTNTCPPGTVGAPYSIRFVESDGSGCGPGRQAFYVDSGLLPQGLTLVPDGSLSGIARQAGTFRFYVEMREPQDDPDNCAGKRTQKRFTLKIRQPPWITSRPAIPPESEVGMSFQMTLRARGGSGVFVWALAAGKLPLGLRLRDDGSIVGTPRLAGTYRFVAMATDTEERSLRWPVTLVVAPRLRVRTLQLARARVGRSYSAELTAVGGAGPTVWKLRRGRLPHGIRLVPALGRFTGTPSEAGRQQLTVEVVDGLNVRSSRTFAIVVSTSPPNGIGRSQRLARGRNTSVAPN
jgi:putative Ig domain-containing protein